MKSMTGYGHSKTETPFSYIEVSIKAINGRFFEPRFHLPREFLEFEANLKKTLSQFFARGTVDIYVLRRMKWQKLKTRIEVHQELVKQYAGAMRDLAAQMKCAYVPHVEFMARLPDVLKIETTEVVSDKEGVALNKAMHQAVKACSRERDREGASIRNDLERLLRDLEGQLKMIGSHRRAINDQIQERLQQKLRAKLGDVDIDPQRLSQEVAFILEKSDINEELVRLNEHVKNYRNLLSQNQPMGKKMDFYTQELLREVNTIGSKSSVSQLTQIVVESKTIIERIREQVQNVE